MITTLMLWLPPVLLTALLMAAMVNDLMFRRIPNRLIVTGLVASVALHWYAHQASLPPPAGEALWAPLTGLLAGGASLLPLYVMRAVGAGDVKLMSMVGAFVGTSTVLNAVLYTLLAGGLLSLLFMALRGITTQTLENVRLSLTDLVMRWRFGKPGALAPLASTAARLPYAVAISAGTAMACGLPLMRAST